VHSEQALLGESRSERLTPRLRHAAGRVSPQGEFVGRLNLSFADELRLGGAGQVAGHVWLCARVSGSDND